MINLIFSRLRPPTLLLAIMVSCLAVDRAAGGMLSSSDPAPVTPAAFARAVSPAPLSDAPGTPYPFTNPGGETIIIGYNATSAQPAPVSSSNILGITNAFAGDVVFLLNPAGTNDPSNWAAVFRFLNLDDSTGANGLPANEVEGFDASNVGPGGFANFNLFPDTIYLADTPTAPGNHTAGAQEFGPDGGILAGQLAIFLYNVDVTGSGVTGPGGGSVPEPSTWAALLGGGAAIALTLRRRNRTLTAA